MCLNVMKIKAIAILILLVSVADLKGLNSWDDPICRKIYEFQDRRNSAGLKPFLSDNNPYYRELAAIAFSSVQDTLMIPELYERLKVEDVTKVRGELIRALGQMYHTGVCNLLITQYPLETVERNKGLMLEAIGKCGGGNSVMFLEKLEIAGTDTLLSRYYSKAVFYLWRKKTMTDTMKGKVTVLYKRYPKDEFIGFVHGKLFVEKKVETKGDKPKPEVMDDRALLAHIDVSPNAYAAVDYLKQFKLSKTLLLQLAFSHHPDYLKSFALEKYFEEKNPDTAVIRQCLNSGNIAFVAMAAGKIRKDSIWLQGDKKQVSYLEGIKHKLLMPQDFEAYIELEKTIAFLNKTKWNYTPPAYNHPIDWTYIQRLKRIEQVKITTGIGVLIMDCYVEDAPASVANFLKLVDSGFYNNRYFHRMVPDFVVQGGCPRGDGWGALNWTQRGEYGPRGYYRMGTVGLASAGKDSEGVQFFITHGYTPHLDGRYTVFGQITEGLELIHLLNIGDRILSIERI